MECIHTYTSASSFPSSFSFPLPFLPLSHYLLRSSAFPQDDTATLACHSLLTLAHPCFPTCACPHAHAHPLAPTLVPIKGTQVLKRQPIPMTPVGYSYPCWCLSILVLQGDHQASTGQMILDAKSCGLGQAKLEPNCGWQLWPGLGFEKAKAPLGQAKARAFRPSQAETSLVGVLGLLFLGLIPRSSTLPMPSIILIFISGQDHGLCSQRDSAIDHTMCVCLLIAGNVIVMWLNVSIPSEISECPSGHSN